MSLGTVLGLICIILAFVVGAANVDFVFNAVTWLVAAIAIVLTLGGVPLEIPVARRKPAPNQ